MKKVLVLGFMLMLVSLTFAGELKALESPSYENSITIDLQHYISDLSLVQNVDVVEFLYFKTYGLNSWSISRNEVNLKEDINIPLLSIYTNSLKVDNLHDVPINDNIGDFNEIITYFDSGTYLFYSVRTDIPLDPGLNKILV